jgi:DnaJ homolog subfamily C member 28
VARSRDLDEWENWIDRQIREAQERGAFDNLPGQGKPLDLAPNPHAQDYELLFKMLKDAGYAPEWIELDKAIRRRLEKARLALARGWQWYNTHSTELAGRSARRAHAQRDRLCNSWHRTVAAFEKEVQIVNEEIAELNLKVPSPRFQRTKVDAADEIARLTKEER